MKISLNELKDINACQPGIDRFIAQTGAKDSEQYDVASLVGGVNKHLDLLWLAGKKIEKDRIVRFTCDCALINIELIKPLTNKYDIVVEFLKKPTCATTIAASAASAVVNITCTNRVADAVYFAIETAVCTNDTVKTVDIAAVCNAVVGTTDDAEAAINELLIEMFNEVE